MTTTGTLRLCAALLALCVFSISAVAQDAIPVLKSKTEDYANVTLLSETPTHVFIKHSRGVASVKRSSLDEPALKQLLTGVVSASVVPASSNTVTEVAVVESGSSEPEVAQVTTVEPGQSLAGRLKHAWSNSSMQLSEGSSLLIVLGVLFLIYLSMCYCARRVCKNAGYDPGILIWIPVLQQFPLLRAAGMSGWWFFAFLIPILGLVAHILWCIKICRECGKGGVAMFFMIFPFTYPFAFLYLAFSSSGGSEQTFAIPVRRQTEPLPS